MTLSGTIDFRPKLLSALSNYSLSRFKDDLIAGPTGAFIVIVYSIIQNYGLQGLAIATLMAGMILILLGLFHLGTVIKFIPYPIVVGFTSGIALTIFSTQINDFFGLGLTDVPSEFLSKWGVYLSNFGNIDPITLCVGALSLAVIILTPMISRKLPGSLIAIVVITAGVYFLQQAFPEIHVETIGDRFGSLSTDIPQPKGFELSMNTINMLLPSAFTIAILGAIESLLSATVADGVTGSRTNSNTELIGQGIANIVVPFFGGIPVTGAIARTMTNITNGGRTPVAGIIHTVVLLLIFLFLMPLINLVPMACLAAVLIVVSYNMSGWRTVVGIFKAPKSDISVLVVTFLLTVIFDLTIAIEIGLLLAIILFLRRVMENTQIRVYSEQLDVAEGTEATSHEVLDVAPGVEVYEIDGPFFFGVATKFDEMMRTSMSSVPVVRIIRMRRVPFIDATGVHNLELLIRSSQKVGIHVVLSGVNEQVRQVLLKSHIDTLIGKDHICDHITRAVDMANHIADSRRASLNRSITNA